MLGYGTPNRRTQAVGCAVLVSSGFTPRNATSLPAYRPATRTNPGWSRSQSRHQVAQTLTTKTFPRNPAADSGAPSRPLPSSWGSGRSSTRTVPPFPSEDELHPMRVRHATSASAVRTSSTVSRLDRHEPVRGPLAARTGRRPAGRAARRRPAAALRHGDRPLHRGRVEVTAEVVGAGVESRERDLPRTDAHDVRRLADLRRVVLVGEDIEV